MAEAEVNVAMPEEDKPDADTVQVLRDLANRLRIHSIRTTCALSTGHPTSCSSAAEIMSVLFFYIMKYKQEDPENPNNDRFILCKRLAFVDVAIGWYGPGLGTACGMAYTGKYFDNASYRVFCLLGDGESWEGSVWEALAFGSHYNLDNLMAIFDVNRLGHSGVLPIENCIEIYQKRCEAFGWNTYVVDGRDVEALCDVFWQAAQVKNKPTAIIAKTFKGRGIPSVEDTENWHGKPMPTERADAIIKLIESQIETNRQLTPKFPVEDSPYVNTTNVEMTSLPVYEVGDKVATRKACGLALAKLGHANDRVIVLDGDTKNSTFSEIFKKEHPERFIECFIAEQNMVNVALGCAIRGRTIAFVSTFAAFLTRAFEQIRIGTITESNINFIGSHSGVSIGEDGPSQMALEDLAMFRTVPNCTVFYPSDAVSTEYAVFLAANTQDSISRKIKRQNKAVVTEIRTEIVAWVQERGTRELSGQMNAIRTQMMVVCYIPLLEFVDRSTQGLCYIRTSRPETDVIYSPTEIFEIGKAKVIRQSVNDKVTVIGAGVTLHEILVAADELSKQDTPIRVIDLFTIKPLDVDTVIAHAKCTGGRIITVEDHHLEGGIGEAVCAAVSMEPDILVHSLAVQGVPRSGKPSELLDMFGISARHIIVSVKCMLTN